MGSLFKNRFHFAGGDDDNTPPKRSGTPCPKRVFPIEDTTPPKRSGTPCPKRKFPIDDGSFKEMFDNAKAAFDRGDYAVSYPAFKELSYAGYAKAYGYLGLAYELGEGVARDIQEAETWYRKSIEAQDHIGVYRLGMLYTNRGQEELAYGIYKQAIDEGFATPDDYFHVATMLETGNGATRDLQQAVNYYKIAMRSVDPFRANDAREALGRLGALYAKDDFDMVLPVELANADTDRLYSLGKNKMDAFDDPDIPYAFACLKNAADRGHALAACMLSRIYGDEKYPICDKWLAKTYAESAAEGMVGFVEQNPTYADEAGYAYQSGYGCVLDQDKAFRCFQIGVQVMDKNCEWRLGMIFQKDGRDEDAFELFSLAAEHGQGMAMYEVAQCFEKGIGTGRDINKAIHWYELCSRSNYAAKSEAKERLRELT